MISGQGNSDCHMPQLVDKSPQDTSLAMSASSAMDTQCQGSDFQNSSRCTQYTDNIFIYPEKMPLSRWKSSTSQTLIRNETMNSPSGMNLSSPSNCLPLHGTSSACYSVPYSHHPHQQQRLHATEDRHQQYLPLETEYMGFTDIYVDSVNDQSYDSGISDCTSKINTDSTFFSSSNEVSPDYLHDTFLYGRDINNNCTSSNFNWCGDQIIPDNSSHGQDNSSSNDSPSTLVVDLLHDSKRRELMSAQSLFELCKNECNESDVSEDNHISRSSPSSWSSMEEEVAYPANPEFDYQYDTGSEIPACWSQNFGAQTDRCGSYPEKGFVFDDNGATHESYGCGVISDESVLFPQYLHNGNITEAASYPLKQIVYMQNDYRRYGSPMSDEGFVDEPPIIPEEKLPHFQQLTDSDRDSHSSHSISLSPKERKKSVRESPPSAVKDVKERRKPGRKPGQVSNVLHLWEFMRDLLHSTDSQGIIEWISKQDGVFRVVNSSEVARLWGEKKKNKKMMTYEKLSRSLRYSRIEGYFADLPKDKNYPKKLCFKFGPRSKDWH